MNISRTIPIFLIATILVFGTTISMGIPASFAQSYEDSYGKDYDKKKTSNLNKQKVNCNNIIINGVNNAGQGVAGGEDMLGAMATDEDGTGQWIENGNDKDSNSINENIVNFCKNKHNKIVVAAEEPEPTTGSLTVKKEIFGCNIISGPNDETMDCQDLGPDSEEWISCDDAPISGTIFCQTLQEDFFDIEVLDEQNNQVVPTFTGSQNGETITGLEPGTYTVNEIVHEDFAPNQLSEVPQTANCADPRGFVSGGILQDDPIVVNYLQICFQFQDEQGEDCSTTIIAAGEAKTCIVKNYIVSAIDDTQPL